MDVEETAEATLEVHEDELDKYLSLPVEKNIDLDVLAWWKAKDCQKDGLPILAKMARQFLGRPASSAGVERYVLEGGQAPWRRQTTPRGYDPRALPLCLHQHRVGMREHARAEQERQRGIPTHGVTGEWGFEPDIS